MTKTCKIKKKASKTKPFNRMSHKEKRVAIAKDVLAHIRYTNIQTGSYFSGVISKETSKHIDGRENAQKHLTKLQKCEVCAIGACLVSHIRLANKINLDSLGLNNHTTCIINNKKIWEVDASEYFIRDILGDYFNLNQLYMIECAFEGGMNSERLRNNDADDCKEFYDLYDTDKQRLKAIMENIILHDGEFNPPRCKI